jgi:hypothetical protein
MQLLVPYAFVNDPQCAQRAATLQLPQLEQLLRALALTDTVTGSADDLSPPHERRRARALGVDAADGCIPWAALELAAAGQVPGASGYAWITPAHWQIGTGHIQMLDPDTLQLQESESLALMQAMAPYFEQDGMALVFQNAGRWLASGEMLADLASASLDRVRGVDVGPWMPAKAALRRLQNEMQMLLYTHPVNDARVARGQQTVNSFWVSGSGSQTVPLPAALEPVTADDLRQPALQGDWEGWAGAWQKVDQGACATLLRELKAGRAAELVLCSERNALVFAAGSAGWGERLRRRFTRASLQQFTPQL